MSFRRIRAVCSSLIFSSLSTLTTCSSSQTVDLLSKTSTFSAYPVKFTMSLNIFKTRAQCRHKVCLVSLRVCMSTQPLTLPSTTRSTSWQSLPSWTKQNSTQCPNLLVSLVTQVIEWSTRLKGRMRRVWSAPSVPSKKDLVSQLILLSGLPRCSAPRRKQNFNWVR